MTTTVSTLVSNATGTLPRVVNAKNLVGGRVLGMVDTIEVPDTADNDICILASIPVDAIILSLEIASDDLGTAGTVDVGLFSRDNPPVGTTFTAVSAAGIATGLDMATAAVAMTQRRFSVPNIDTVKKRAWEIAGLSARPAYEHFYIGLTTTTGTTTAGTVSIKALYMV